MSKKFIFWKKSMFKKIIIFSIFLLIFTNVLAADLTSPNFVIHIWDITPWDNSLVEWTVKNTLNNIIWTVIQKLMIALWAISLFVMTIWAWYMILYHGQDELLSKWKSIFMAWIISLVVALSSYYLVSLVRFILYSNT